MPSFLPLGLGDKRPKEVIIYYKTRKLPYKILEPTRLKKKPPIGREPIDISKGEFWSANSLPSSPCLSRQDKDKDIEMEEIVKLLPRQGKKRKYP